MMLNFSKFLLLILTAVLAGCTQDSRVGPLEAKVDALEKKIEQLEFQINLQSDMGKWDSIAYLTPGLDGYSAVKMDLGYLTVSLANIAPYANGSKITLVFGNLTSATIDGLKAKIEWGPVDEKALPRNNETKSRDVELKESMSAGTWNKSDVVLEGIPPTALGFVRIKDITHRGIRLGGRSK